MAATIQAHLLQQYYHVALPRELPGHEDSSLSAVESALLMRFIDAVKALNSLVPLQHFSSVDAIRLSLVVSQTLNDGRVSKNLLEKEMQELKGKHALVIHVTEQNAALLIYRKDSGPGDDLIFEAFETSASCEKVLASKNALRWDFPGRACSVPSEVYSDSSFRKHLAEFVDQASSEYIKQFAAVAIKADASIPEIRDTTDPALVTQLLMTILECAGSSYRPTRLSKRVRDTVSFMNARKPWRRSPFYLAVRVAIQRHAYKLLGPDAGRVYYKTIMCVLVMRLMEDCTGNIPHEAIHFLKQKLGRRVAKLVGESNSLVGPAKDFFNAFFTQLASRFKCCLEKTEEQLQLGWNRIMSQNRRIIRLLPMFADPPSMRLSLRLSGSYLKHVITHGTAYVNPTITVPLEYVKEYDQTVLSKKPFTAVSNHWINRFRFREQVVLPAKSDTTLTSDDQCVQQARVIQSYISDVGDTFNSYPDAMSQYILDLMELWVELDRDTISTYPLLRRYHPGFEPGMLDTLQLPTAKDLRRVNAVQDYLLSRCSDWSGEGSRTIFTKPTDDSFAVQYFNETPVMQDFRNSIQTEAMKTREAKIAEYDRLKTQYDDLQQRRAETACVSTTTVMWDGTVIREHRNCLYHRLGWEARQIKIQIFEWPLPISEPAARAAVFELLCPESFKIYRDTTFLLLAKFAHVKSEPVEQVSVLSSYPPLQRYARRFDGYVTLASPIKSHSECHYSEIGFPVTWEQVCRPCGLKLDYFDMRTKTWVIRDTTASFSGHFPLNLPPTSPFKALNISPHQWPSSNRVLANSSKCPADLSWHEFIAWQGLLVGTHGRWLSLLREIGATNINFSSESSWVIVSKLMLEVGPASTLHPYRDVHVVFDDETFCLSLLKQVEYRMNAIWKNWREPIQMDILISILLKLQSFTFFKEIHSRALGLLVQARIATWNWCKTLQSEENHGSREAADSACWASVLCKRTFHMSLDMGSPFTSESLRYFVFASVTLQESLVGKLEEMPFSLRSAIFRDLEFSYKNLRLIRKAILANPEAFLAALDDIWPFEPDSLWTQPQFQTVLNDRYIQVCVQKDKNSPTFFVHFHVLRGDLLINGKQSGALPAEYRLPIVESIFGTYNLRVFPSFLAGMSLYIAKKMPYSHRIHLGFRQQKLIVRAAHYDVETRQGYTLELIPPALFRNRDALDLPTALVANCHHWLNINTAVIEIRQGDLWKSKDSNWRVNLHTCQGIRRGSILVDPNSSLAKTVADNFYYFELPEHITIYQQPEQGRLSVELKRIELNFFVNKNGLLQCPQLAAVVVKTREQDVGTWYGLRSQLVLRSLSNYNQRIVLVRLGKFKTRRDAQHVIVITDLHEETYLKFTVNELLGRIECPAEPRLLYFKAMCHALTSYILPDPLTRRTGVEEALSLFSSALYKPWTQLPQIIINDLIQVAKLTPRRVYYPLNLQRMETTFWDPGLTNTIQDDRYRRVIESICQRSFQLSCFDTSQTSDRISSHFPVGNPHLENRTIARSCFSEVGPEDQGYAARDVFMDNIEQTKARTMGNLAFTWPSRINNPSNIIALLEKLPIIGGCVGNFKPAQIFELLTIDVGVQWGSILQTAIVSGPDDRFRLMFQFATMGFSKEIDLGLLRVLLSFAILPDLKAIVPPIWPSFSRFISNEVPLEESFIELMKPAHVPYQNDPKNKPPVGQAALKRLEHQDASLKSSVKLFNSLLQQWPCAEIDRQTLTWVDHTQLDKERAVELVLPDWTRLTHNFALSKYIYQVQKICDRHNVELSSGSITPVSSDQHIATLELYPLGPCDRKPITLSGLIETTIAPHHKEHRSEEMKTVLHNVTNSSKARFNHALSKNGRKETSQALIAAQPRQVMQHIEELSEIVRDFQSSPSMLIKKYGGELQQSIEALIHQITRQRAPLQLWPSSSITDQIAHAESSYKAMMDDISCAFEKSDNRAMWLKHANQWPRVTLLSLLAELRSTSGTKFGNGMKLALVNLGLEITALQRLLRIHDASLKNKQQQFNDEHANMGHVNWSPVERPDWLLLEIDSNLMLREEQIDVANATIAPRSTRNTVLQLLMGKGKTSCILPMVAAVLADKSNLMRIVVPRPLLLQSAQVIQSRLGYLVDREVLHIPFSRQTSTRPSLMQTFEQLHKNLRMSSGVMLALPENLLSFKLSGIQRLCDNYITESQYMIRMQEWIYKYARDVLDECDASLAIKTQLIYPSGFLMTVDGHPLRWQTVQAVLRLVHKFVPQLQHQFPQSIEVVNRVVGEYPLVYFLRKDAEDHLIWLLVEDICKGQLAFLPCAEISSQIQEDIRGFISNQMIHSSVVSTVNDIFHDKQHLLKILYLLRGLFVHRILLSALKKRWNVQYGLHPQRDPIAVPFLAKGTPSPTSEWGHPDVAILLTCLSFYYQGLDLSQFRQAFQQLLKLDEPSVEYDKWITDSLPDSFRDHNAINLEDHLQICDVHLHLRFNLNLVDFYLNMFVFPRHARQFDTKLQASGWDLVLFNPSAPAKCKTTGFSGTNDARHQLPLTIRQNDLAQLAHTNAEVLSYLLEKRNRQYVRMVDNWNVRLTEDGLLSKLKQDNIRILIDAGAQILERDNYNTVKVWLKIDHEASAAVFFDSKDRATVLYPKGRTVPLVATPFAEDLERCLVYFDESHCRGTDLKLPVNARAALTLGPHVTKDSLAQAAMRLRLLGQTQSVTFLSPLEVHQSILDIHEGALDQPIDSAHVIKWLLKQSCNQIEQLEPLYYAQGKTYLQHAQIQQEIEDIFKNPYKRTRYIEHIQSKEACTLKQLYEPKPAKKNDAIWAQRLRGQLLDFALCLQQRKKDFQDIGVATQSNALEEVEQEREVENEVEAVRETQVPVHFNALKFKQLREDIVSFVKSGRIFLGSSAYQQMLEAWKKTALGSKYQSLFKESSRKPRLYVSTEFSRTVKTPEPNDNFLRPCHWLLLNRKTEKAMIISPEEADALLPMLRQHRSMKDRSAGYTHLVVYCAPVTRRMLHFNDLDYHATPPLPKGYSAPLWLKIELGIFAGRLYFEWDEYTELCVYLRESADKPLSLLHDWLSVMRKGQDFEHTPMGFVTTGKLLVSEHHFFQISKSEQSDKQPKATIMVAAPCDDESDTTSEDDDDCDELGGSHHFMFDDTIEDEEEYVDGNAFFNAKEFLKGSHAKEQEDDQDGHAGE